jgi:hypothetical protein
MGRAPDSYDRRSTDPTVAHTPILTGKFFHMNEVITMLDKTVTTVKELFSLYATAIRLADKIILDGDNGPNWIASYKAARVNLEVFKMNLKK